MAKSMTSWTALFVGTCMKCTEKQFFTADSCASFSDVP